MAYDEGKKIATGIIIHGFAVAHAATAALLAQTLVGDEAALTALTTAMIFTVALLNGSNWNFAKILKFFGIFAGKYFGVRGATFLIKWIPGLGNAANAAVTFTITEVLGWATYIIVSSATDVDSMTDAQKKDLIKKAQRLREEESEKSKHLYESMSDKDKREFEEITRELRNQNLSDQRKIELSKRLEAIVNKYK